jgi:anti-sigma factor (TIGR02949 family)
MGGCHQHEVCRDLAEKLLLFRDGTLPPEDTEHLRLHLQQCPKCLDLLSSYDEVVEVLQRLEPVGMPPGLLERMRARMAEELSSPGD